MKQYSLRKFQTLQKQKEFEAVFKTGQIWEKKNALKAHFKKNGLSFSRFGISISKRCGNAVFRNSIKRIVREWFRMHARAFPYSIDVVFIFNSRIDGYSPDLIRRGLDEFLEKCRLFLKE